MTLDGLWFTERAPEIGTAFSLYIKEKLHEERTPYQFLEIYETTHFGRIMVLDGFIMLSQRDNFIYHEMMAHPALFSHPEPARVAIIGGGDCGTLKEVLKHDTVARAWQVDIDERVTRNAERFFPELCEANADPRAELIFADGIEWMDNAPADSLDIVIVDSTDPIGPAEGLFREPFYRSCRRALGEHGIVIQQSESPLVHTDTITFPMRAAMGAAGFGDVQTLFFPLAMYPTGWWSATLAANAPIEFRRRADADARAFATDYYNTAIHQAAFVAPEFFSKAGKR
jgi:spermidine synthase